MRPSATVRENGRVMSNVSCVVRDGRGGAASSAFLGYGGKPIA
jgi:hypothetical protein